jgi:hypothetical protein
VQLRVAGVPGGLEPLGSLRLALLRKHPSPDDVTAHHGEALGAVAGGEPRPLADIRDGLTTMLRGGWVVMDPVAGVDSVTLEVLLQVAQTHAPRLCLMRLPMDAPLPGAVAGHTWQEIVLPSLRGDDAKAVARGVLVGADEEIVRRVAVLGGDTVVGVLEAARTLVAAGDLVFDGKKFAWRSSPRAGVRGIPLDDLLEERLGALEEEPVRLLEAICAMPQGTPRLLVAAIAERDGLDSEVRRHAVLKLEAEGYATRGDVLSPTSEALRRVTLRRMPPARQAELCRFAADAMRASSAYSGPLIGATIGFYVAEGGDPDAGAALLLEAAQAAAEAGLVVPARKLAAVAVQLDPRSETRGRAVAISRGVADDDPLDDGRVSQVAIHALLTGDLETLERTVDTAIAEGRDLGAADRLRAMALLARGDVAGALAAFGRMKSNAGEDPKAHSMASLTYAWIQLHLGEPSKAIRAGLEALAASRRIRDPRGEAAALHTLSACFRSVDRPEEAARVSEAAPD